MSTEAKIMWAALGALLAYTSFSAIMVGGAAVALTIAHLSDKPRRLTAAEWWKRDRARIARRRAIDPWRHLGVAD